MASRITSDDGCRDFQLSAEIQNLQHCSIEPPFWRPLEAKDHMQGHGRTLFMTEDWSTSMISWQSLPSALMRYDPNDSERSYFQSVAHIFVNWSCLKSARLYKLKRCFLAIEDSCDVAVTLWIPISHPISSYLSSFFRASQKAQSVHSDVFWVVAAFSKAAFSTQTDITDTTYSSRHEIFTTSWLYDFITDDISKHVQVH